MCHAPSPILHLVLFRSVPGPERACRLWGCSRKEGAWKKHSLDPSHWIYFPSFIMVVFQWLSRLRHLQGHVGAAIFSAPVSIPELIMLVVSSKKRGNYSPCSKGSPTRSNISSLICACCLSDASLIRAVFWPRNGDRTQHVPEPLIPHTVCNSSYLFQCMLHLYLVAKQDSTWLSGSTPSPVHSCFMHMLYDIFVIACSCCTSIKWS